MRRREFISLIGCIAAVCWPLPSSAQGADRAPRIGVLLAGTSARAGGPLMQAFYHALRDFGWIEGHNVIFERRFAEGKYSRLSDLAVELAHLNVDIIVTASTP